MHINRISVLCATNNMLLYIFLGFAFTGFCLFANGEDLIATTPYGRIKGFQSVSYGGRKFTTFLGVPYAKPPLGDLRFQEPQPLESWSGTWAATKTTECIQVNHSPHPEGGNLMGDEDCLYLNIFVSRENITSGKLLPVIVHIHGGGFNFGYGNNYAGPAYIMDRDVVFVTFNYRLGPLGFLSTEDDIVPGNNGMKDQVAALKWIKSNIEHFGGDPDTITITGLSAGGASVHYHYLSPLSKGLFNAGISVSGTVLCAWTLQKAALEKTRTLAANVGCLQKSTNDLISCLRQRPARQIVESVRLFRPWLYNPFAPFSLVVEKSGKNPFLPDDPYLLLSKGKVHDLPWLTSTTSDEGLYPGADYALKGSHLPYLEKKWEHLAPYILDYDYTVLAQDKPSVAKKIKEFYLKDKSISKNTYKQLIQLMSDRLFVVPSEKSAKLQARVNKSPVYYYHFSYPGEKQQSFAKYYTLSDEKYGVCHGDDIVYILSNPSTSIAKMTKADEKMKELLLDIWFSFATTSSPHVQGIKWTPVDSKKTESLNFLHIRSPKEVAMETAQEMGHRTFWDSIPFKEYENLLSKDAKVEL